MEPFETIKQNYQQQHTSIRTLNKINFGCSISVFISTPWVCYVVPIIDMSISVGDILANPIISTPALLKIFHNIKMTK